MLQNLSSAAVVIGAFRVNQNSLKWNMLTISTTRYGTDYSRPVKNYDFVTHKVKLTSQPPYYFICEVKNSEYLGF